MKLFPSIYHPASLLQMTPLFSIEPRKKVPQCAEYCDSSFQMVNSGRAVLSPLSFVLYFFFFFCILHVSEWSTDLMKGSTCPLTLFPHLEGPTQKNSSVKMWNVVPPALYLYCWNPELKGKASRSFALHLTSRDADLGGNFCESWFCQPTYSLLSGHCWSTHGMNCPLSSFS